MADRQDVDIKRHVDAACKVVDLRYNPPQLALRADVEKAMLELIEELREAFLDNSMEKLLAMSDDQVSALCRLEGHNPADQAKLARQVFKIVQLRIALEGTTAALENMSDFWAYGMAKAEGAEADEHDTRMVTSLGNAAREAVDGARRALRETKLGSAASSEDQRHGS